MMRGVTKLSKTWSIKMALATHTIAYESGLRPSQLGSWKIRDQSQRGPGNEIAHVRDESGDAGQKGDAERVVNTQDTQNQQVRQRRQEKDQDLASQERVPDAAEFSAQAANIVCIAGNADRHESSAHVAALHQDEVRDEKNEERPTQKLRRAGGQGADERACAAERAAA